MGHPAEGVAEHCAFVVIDDLARQSEKAAAAGKAAARAAKAGWKLAKEEARRLRRAARKAKKALRKALATVKKSGGRAAFNAKGRRVDGQEVTIRENPIPRDGTVRRQRGNGGWCEVS